MASPTQIDDADGNTSTVAVKIGGPGVGVIMTGVGVMDGVGVVVRAGAALTWSTFLPHIRPTIKNMYNDNEVSTSNPMLFRVACVSLRSMANSSPLTFIAIDLENRSVIVRTNT